VRRSTFERVGLFEEGLGAHPFNGETELAFRAIRAGLPVYLSPAFPVVHEYGSRPLGEPARRLLRTYHMGKSAMLIKHTLRFDLGAACKLVLLAFEPLVDALGSVLRTGRPSGLGMMIPYLDGIRQGMRLVRPGRRELRLRANL